MRTSLNPFMYTKRESLDWTKNTAGNYRIIVQPGNYRIKYCGGGGAGGTNGSANNFANDSTIPGNGGAGGTAYKSETEITLNYGAEILVSIGAGGKTYANGGNGANGGGGGYRYINGITGGASDANAGGGAGGGGGWPTIVTIQTRQNAFYWGLGLYTLHRAASVVYDANGNRLTEWTHNATTFVRSDGYTYTPEGVVASSLPQTIEYFANGAGGGGGGGKR